MQNLIERNSTTNCIGKLIQNASETKWCMQELLRQSQCTHLWSAVSGTVLSLTACCCFCLGRRMVLLWCCSLPTRRDNGSWGGGCGGCKGRVTMTDSVFCFVFVVFFSERVVGTGWIGHSLDFEGLYWRDLANMLTTHEKENFLCNTCVPLPSLKVLVGLWFTWVRTSDLAPLCWHRSLIHELNKALCWHSLWGMKKCLYETDVLNTRVFT